MGLERLAAGVIVIGLILWGASVLATPDDPMASQEGEPREETVEDLPPVPIEEPRDERDDDQDGEDAEEPDEETPEPTGGKRKRGRGGG